MDSEGGTIETKKPFIPEFPYRQLPPNSKPLSYWIEQGEPKIVDILNYMNSRALYFDDYDWHWSNDPKFKERLIIPFTYKNKIVGYTARAIGQSNQRYFSEQSTGYVFNTDNQPYDRKFAILCEGPLDAISIGGIASLGSNVSPSQNCVIAQLQKEIILVPDKDDAGMKLIECALEYGWSVSFPDWDDDIKDINDAVVRYGRLCTLYKIIQAKITNQLKIQILSKEWRRNGS
jgi:DNA primase